MMTANIKLTLCLSLPVGGKNLEEALTAARLIEFSDLVKIKPTVSHNDSALKVTGIDTGEWTD